MHQYLVCNVSTCELPCWDWRGQGADLPNTRRSVYKTVLVPRRFHHSSPRLFFLSVSLLPLAPTTGVDATATTVPRRPPISKMPHPDAPDRQRLSPWECAGLPPSFSPVLSPATLIEALSLSKPRLIQKQTRPTSSSPHLYRLNLARAGQWCAV
jgi:hypothetical protein